MSVETYNAGAYTGLASGVDDFESTDLQLPRLKILHADAKFSNPQTEEEFEYLDCIVLGFVKQRVMFDPVYDDSKVDNSPWCKSNDHEIGFPGVEFPWERSNRTGNDLQVTELGNHYMPCKGCNFQNWGPKNPKNGKSTPPPCNELHTYAILYYNQGTQEYLPALISFKSSSIKASTSFMQNFVTSRRPIFTVFTRIELTSHRKGSVPYSVAKFSVIGDSPQENWADYSSQSISVREMLRAEPVIQGDESEEDEAQAYAPPAQAAPTQAAPTQAAPTQAAPASDPDVIQGQVVADPVTEPSHPAQGRTRPTPPKPPTPPARRAPAAPQAQAAPAAPVAGPSEDSDDNDYMPF